MATKKKAAKKSAGRKKTSARKGAAKKKSTAGRKSAGRKSTAKKKTGGAKRKPNAAFMKPMQPSEELAQVVGSSPLPRTEVTKKLWAYIRRKGLQDAKERRMINADDNLKPIFNGKKQVSMFDMTKLVSKHLKDA